MEGAPVVNEGDHDLLNLPPGFRFHPTDEEIITHYLTRKVLNVEFTATAVGEVDLNQCEPWDLPKKAKMGEKEWFFFCQRDRKYPTGMRTNRATESGYWKATGKDKEIYSKGKGKSQLVGMKKTLVFYKGRAPKGEKTNWVMHEFRLQGNFSYYDFPKSAKDEWVVCKVFHKNTGAMIKRSPMTDLMRMNSFVEGLLNSPSLPPLMDHSPFSNINYGITTEEDDYKGTTTAIPARFSDVNSLTYPQTNQIQMQQNPFSTNYQMPNNSMSYSENGNFPYQAASSSLGPVGYLHQQRINSNPSFPESANFQQATNNQRQCKVEQFSSNQSMVSRSQDTGLSTDLTAEISSKQDIESHSVGFSHLDSFWDY